MRAWPSTRGQFGSLVAGTECKEFIFQSNMGAVSLLL